MSTRLIPLISLDKIAIRIHAYTNIRFNSHQIPPETDYKIPHMYIGRMKTMIHVYRHENFNVSLDVLCNIEQLEEINDYYCITLYAIKNVQYSNYERGNVDNGIALNDENPKGYAIC